MNNNKKNCIAIVVGIGLVMFSCTDRNSTRGIIADNPTEVIVKLFDCWNEKSDCINLCSKSINKSKISHSAAVVSNAKGSYVITDNGHSIYQKLNGKTPKLNSNQMIYRIISSGGKAGPFHTNLGEKFEGYVIVEQHTGTNRYYIADISIKDSK